MDFLPPEMVEEIFSKLSVDDLKSFRLTSKYYETLANRCLKKLVLISINSNNVKEIINLDTSNISPFLSSLLIESASVKIAENKYDVYGREWRTQELNEFFRTKTIRFRHFNIKKVQLQDLENYMGPSVSFLTELKLTAERTFDKILRKQNVFKFCPNLEILSIKYKTKFSDDPEEELEELKNCFNLKCAPNLKSLIFEKSINEKNFIPLINLVSNHPKLRTISLKILIPEYLQIEIKSYSNFEDIRIVFTDIYYDFKDAKKSKSFKCLNNFLEMKSDFILTLSLSFWSLGSLEKKGKRFHVFNKTELPPLPLLPKCKELTIDACKYNFTSQFLLNSSFPTLRKIVTKSSPNVLYCAEKILSARSLEIWNGFFNGKRNETNNWAASFPNTVELIIKSPSTDFFSSVIKEMKNLVVLNLIDVNSNFWQILTGKFRYVPILRPNSAPKSARPIERKTESIESLSALKKFSIEIGENGCKETIDGIIYMTIMRKINRLDELVIKLKIRTSDALGKMESERRGLIKKLRSYHNRVVIKEIK